MQQDTLWDQHGLGAENQSEDDPDADRERTVSEEKTMEGEERAVGGEGMDAEGEHSCSRIEDGAKQGWGGDSGGPKVEVLYQADAGLAHDHALRAVSTGHDARRIAC